MLQAKNIFQTTREALQANQITIKEAARIICKAGFTNFTDIYTTIKLLDLDPSLYIGSMQNVKNEASPIIDVKEPEQPDENTGSTEGRKALENARLQAAQNKSKSFKDLRQGNYITLIQGLGKECYIKDLIRHFSETDFRPAYPLCRIERIEELSDEELNKYDFLCCKPEGFEGGSRSYVYDLYKNRFNPTKEIRDTVVRVVCMLRTPSRCLFVDPQGYSYSRYILALPESLNSMFAPEFEELREEKRREEEERAKAAAEKERAENEAIEEYKKYLTPVSGYDPKTVKKNILSLLRYNFKGVKFTARKTSGSYNITWTDGPSCKEVEKLCAIFCDHCLDPHTDYYDYTPSKFNKVFGGIRYEVDITRKYSDDVLTYGIEKVRAEYPELTGNYNDNTRAGVKVSHESEILTLELINQLRTFTLTEAVDLFLNRISFYKEPEKSATDGSEKTANTNEMQGLTLIQYSAKAVAIIGNTFPFKEQLKKIGGRWNARLTCGAGWVFSRKKEDELRAVFNLS